MISSPWRVVWIGVVALAIAMGIGRFAFTPLLPLMLRDETINTSGGAEWAAANYAGYLIGALTASRFSNNPRAGLLLALIGVTITTLLGTWLGAAPGPLSITLSDSLSGSLPGFFASPYIGPLIRACAGVFSAWTLVCASTWCLAELAKQNSAKLGAWIYSGVGLGIAAAGVLAWLGGWQQASTLWAELGSLAALGTVLIAVGIRHTGGIWQTGARSDAAKSPPPNQAASTASNAPLPESFDREHRRHHGLVFCYGAFGFGYIVQATFLPAMARQQVSDPLVFGLTWPLFGAAAALSVMAAARYLSGWPRRRVWALAQGTMALGTALPLVSHALWALAASAVLVGGTFMVATMAGLQLAREQEPNHPMPLLARMTVAFAVGQIAGPLLIRLLGVEPHGGVDAITWTNALATGLLCVTALWLWRGSPAGEKSGYSTT